MKRGARAWAAAWALGVGACAAHVSPDDGGAEAGRTDAALADAAIVDGDLATDPVEFQRRVIRARCEQYARCPGSGSSLFATVDVCLAYWLSAGTREDIDGRTRALVASGRLRYDAAAARRCIDALDAACRTDGPIACEQVLVGAVPEGAACSLNTECAPGNYCAGIDPRATQCAGTCRPQDLAPGQPYGAAGVGQCQSEAGYYPRSRSGTCELVRDGAPAAEGGQCGDIGESPGHFVRVGCTAGLVCSLRPSDPPRFDCVAPRALGDACEGGVLCAAGLVCMRSRDGRSTCRRSSEAQTRVEGGPCISERTPDAETECDALLGLRCNAEGRCERVAGSGREGEPCVRGQSSSGLCAPGLACERDAGGREGHCRRRRADGEECPAGGESCRSGACSEGRCGPSCY